MNEYISIDMGATSTRIIVGKVDKKISLEEIYRFNNYYNEENDTWNIKLIFDEIIKGINEVYKRGFKPYSLSIDTWGVDFVDDPTHVLTYRSQPTNDAIVDCDKKYLFMKTGIQYDTINTINRIKNHEFDLLFIRDYLNFLLTGEKYTDYTIASTSQLFNTSEMTFSDEIHNQFFDKVILPQIVKPGSTYLNLLPKFSFNDLRVLVGAGHDTANCFYYYGELNNIVLNLGTWVIVGANIENAIVNDKVYESGFSNEMGVVYPRLIKNIQGLFLLEKLIKEHKITGGYNKVIEVMENNDHNQHIDINKLDTNLAISEQLVELNIENNFGYQAVLIINSLAKSIEKNIELLEEISGKDFTNVIIMGGGTKNKVITDKLLNNIKYPIIIGDSEATSLGNILLQDNSRKDI